MLLVCLGVTNLRLKDIIVRIKKLHHGYKINKICYKNVENLCLNLALSFNLFRITLHTTQTKVSAAAADAFWLVPPFFSFAALSLFLA